MRYFIDTEFYERGHELPIQLISLGVVANDGREFYAENSDVDLEELSPWLKENVVPHLTGPRMPHAEIGPAFLRFLGNDMWPSFWGYFADYDWVLFCQLFGSMMSLPDFFPQFCLDVRQVMYQGVWTLPNVSFTGPQHNALVDARWTKAVIDRLEGKRSL